MLEAKWSTVCVTVFSIRPFLYSMINHTIPFGLVRYGLIHLEGREIYACLIELAVYEARVGRMHYVAWLVNWHSVSSTKHKKCNIPIETHKIKQNKITPIKTQHPFLQVWQTREKSYPTPLTSTWKGQTSTEDGSNLLYWRQLQVWGWLRTRPYLRTDLCWMKRVIKCPSH